MKLLVVHYVKVKWLLCNAVQVISSYPLERNDIENSSCSSPDMIPPPGYEEPETCSKRAQRLNRKTVFPPSNDNECGSGMHIKSPGHRQQSLVETHHKGQAGPKKKKPKTADQNCDTLCFPPNNLVGSSTMADTDSDVELSSICSRQPIRKCVLCGSNVSTVTVRAEVIPSHGIQLSPVHKTGHCRDAVNSNRRVCKE